VDGGAGGAGLGVGDAILAGRAGRSLSALLERAELSRRSDTGAAGRSKISRLATEAIGCAATGSQLGTGRLGRSLFAEETSAELSRVSCALGSMRGLAGWYSVMLSCKARRSALRSSSCLRRSSTWSRCDCDVDAE